jgi:hypothetical protein
MNAVVFVGPTLPVQDASRVLDVRYLPPAAQGDVLRVALTEPRLIAIVDGYFERVPSVWHKEILFAMSRGIHVFGAASMGALRAAELADFGMEGVGKIYSDYATGVLNADDEVAVAHLPAEDGYRSFSEAMVNIRATLAAALARQLISPETAAALIAVAKGLFYPDRDYRRILTLARDAGVARDEVERLATFLPTGRVDQKRLDAIALLELVKVRLTAGLEPKQVTYHFEHTDAWEYMLSHMSPMQKG